MEWYKMKILEINARDIKYKNQLSELLSETWNDYSQASQKEVEKLLENGRVALAAI